MEGVASWFYGIVRNAFSRASDKKCPESKKPMDDRSAGASDGR
jgi:hypothetical protein